jgi:ABC-2 type transport system ATP-binding protein
MVQIENLHFSYGKNKVFTGINACLKAGHIYGILGKNGTGKSTLLYNIAGLLYPTEGYVDVLGFIPGKRQPAFLQDIFMVSEEFHLPDIPISKLIQYHSPFYPKFSAEQFLQYIRDFDIPEESTLQNMSYGQKKKVLISFGVATNVSLLLMDEPTNGLDIISKSKLRKIIAGAMDDTKCMLISSHQVKDLENLIDDVVIIEDTRIILQQSLERIAKKLSFQISLDVEETAGVLYSEQLLMGKTLVRENTIGHESKVDLELLYKATMADPDKIQSALV